MPHKQQLIEKELEDLLEVECRAREFVEQVEREMSASEKRGDALPPFATRTLDFVKEVKPHLEGLDSARRGKSD